jgi:hypothetical protein
VSIAYEGRLKVFWLETIADDDLEEITVAEMGAGSNLTPYIPVAGVDRPSQQNQASLAMLDNAFISEEPGTWSVGPIGLTFTRDPGNEESTHPWNIFEYGKQGYLVVSPDGSEVFDSGSGFEAGGDVSVYEVSSHEPAEMPSAENTKQQFMVSFPVRRFVRRAAIVA